MSRKMTVGAMLLAMLAAQAAAGEGSAIAIDAEVARVPLFIRKLAVTDSRVVRGFRGSPVDGTTRSYDFMFNVSEYPDPWSERFDSSSGVDYTFNDNDGLHLTLEPGKVDAVVLRGGAHTGLYSGVEGLTEPEGMRPLATFDGATTPQVRLLNPPADALRGLSFFGTRDGYISDVQFFSIGDRSVEGRRERWWPGTAQATLPAPRSPHDAASIRLALDELYPEPDRATHALGEGGAEAGSIDLAAGRAFHLISNPLKADEGLSALAIEFDKQSRSPVQLTLIIHDPLDPRLELVWLPLEVNGPTRLEIDLPDQVPVGDCRLWITLLAERDMTLLNSSFTPVFIPREEALPEALRHRKFLLKHHFILLSEPRPWSIQAGKSREEIFTDPEWKYGSLCPQLFMTIDQCHALAPEDPLVRQYREWVFSNEPGVLGPADPPAAPPEGVPAWAWYGRQSWLELRRVAEWWLDNRLVPTGEFGGKPGDDSDLYQQFTDLVWFEEDGVGGRLREAGERLADLVVRDHLTEGISRQSFDALHAYEEGLNHLALMARWRPGDPVAIERCMESAGSVERLLTPVGEGGLAFRDFRKIGYELTRNPPEPFQDGYYAPAMLHTTMALAEATRHPRALATLAGWSGAWSAAMAPGSYATALDARTGMAVTTSTLPLGGPFQAAAFLWIARLTDNPGLLDPFMHFYREGKAPGASSRHLARAWNLGLLDGLSSGTLARLAEASPPLALYIHNDPRPLVEWMIGDEGVSRSVAISDLHDARRWPDMYTTAEPFNDRIFPGLVEKASLCFLGGHSVRNDVTPSLGVSWEGFGTDYAALVTRNRRDGLTALVYNFRPQPMTGRARVWALDRGRYRVGIGADSDGDLRGESFGERQERELGRGDAIEITLAPGAVTVIELDQVERFDPVFDRPDLALSNADTRLEGDRVRGFVHNIGNRSAPETLVALVDDRGTIVASVSVPALDAPLDYAPRRQAFEMALPAAITGPLEIIVDPAGRVEEIEEANNSFALVTVH